MTQKAIEEKIYKEYEQCKDLIGEVDLRIVIAARNGEFSIKFTIGDDLKHLEDTFVDILNSNGFSVDRFPNQEFIEISWHKGDCKASSSLLDLKYFKKIDNIPNTHFLLNKKDFIK